jgi:hypothetical protein
MADALPLLNRRFGDPMYVIAGLPPTVSARVANYLEGKIGRGLPRAIYHAPDFSGNDDTLYLSEDYVKIRRRIATVILDNIEEKKIKRGAPLITPSRIVLLYVSFPERVRTFLRNFEFFVYPVVMRGPDGEPRWRHNTGLASEIVEKNIAEIDVGAPEFREVVREISQHGTKSVLALPLRNFHHPAPIGEYFREVYAKNGLWAEVVRKFQMRRYRKEQFPDVKWVKRQGVNAFTDMRELAFLPPPPSLWHGPPREPSSFADSQVIFNKMNELYRLGIPLPDGFHFDAQLTDRRSLTNVEIVCCEKGKRDTRGWQYANIYPNDFVREG